VVRFYSLFFSFAVPGTGTGNILFYLSSTMVMIFSLSQADKITNFFGAGPVGLDPVFGSATVSARTTWPRARNREPVGAARTRNTPLWFIFYSSCFSPVMPEDFTPFRYRRIMLFLLILPRQMRIFRLRRHRDSNPGLPIKTRLS
jgi:hypothetical protein